MQGGGLGGGSCWLVGGARGSGLLSWLRGRHGGGPSTISVVVRTALSCRAVPWTEAEGGGRGENLVWLGARPMAAASMRRSLLEGSIVVTLHPSCYSG